MRSAIAVLALSAGFAHAQPADENAARSYVASAFLTGAQPGLLSEDLQLGPKLREALGLSGHLDRDRIYRALIDTTLGERIEVAKAPKALAGPGQAALRVRIGRELQLVVRYDLRAEQISYVGLPAESTVEVAAVKTIAPRPSFATVAPVLFAFDSAALDEAAQAQLEAAAAERLRRALRIHLTGHADIIGAEDYNLHLSEEREHAVRERLIALGVDASRIELVAAGAEPAPGCDDVRPREAYIACLGSERRVDVVLELAPGR